MGRKDMTFFGVADVGETIAMNMEKAQGGGRRMREEPLRWRDEDGEFADDPGELRPAFDASGDLF